ncbi:hypothetical protein GCM10022198_14800 [Klugiella xanthotipulae]|uniref:N-acetylmuramoyl-L-alanine amidase n=1 Tax=Klugiella xanthotipulae TaxID=244735 RepID=A0A543I6M9_9MICO|nr:N-acetylmuramoyl-L-alanine amidase [Klugiella xanthotipulae]TQM66228.1 N-acetylmuramoyl-L-alanine amidase [Klugiella xanthotipulae]
MNIRTIVPDGRKYTRGRPNGTPNLFVIHHQAGYQENSIRALTTGQGAPSANYIISGADVVASVPEGDTPWTNNNWASNTKSITFELANAPGMQPPSQATLESAAQIMASAARRWEYSLPLRRGVNVYGHNEVADKPTACPGGTNLSWLIARANQILESSPPGSSVGAAAPPDQEALAQQEVARVFAEIRRSGMAYIHVKGTKTHILVGVDARYPIKGLKSESKRGITTWSGQGEIALCRDIWGEPRLISARGYEILADILTRDEPGNGGVRA